MEIAVNLRNLLHLQETPPHYAVKTFSGATLLRPKSEIQYAWQLLQGILDDGEDSTDLKRRERDLELAHDERKSSEIGS